MNITLHKLGRRYNRDWVFRNLDYTFSSGKKYAVLGPNGSGKSTLLKVLSGSLSPSEGDIVYNNEKGVTYPVESLYQRLTVAAPYVELIEEFTLKEMLDFHFKFKPFLTGYDHARVLDLLAMSKSENKEIRFYSSGMKQRVKLALACCSASQLVLLDEPTSNLDHEGEDWYISLVEQTVSADRTLIIGSNQEKEYSFCEEHLNILSYK